MNFKDIIKIFDIKVYMVDITEIMYNYVNKTKDVKKKQNRDIYPPIE